MRMKWAFLVVPALLALALAGCQSYPSQVLLDPDHFENDAVRIDWAIGLDFFRLKISNTSDAQADLDLVNSAVISVDGEAKHLSSVIRRDAVMIPPKSYVVLAADQGAIFGADIYGKFNAESEEKYPLGGGLGSDDRVFLKSHSGQSLRLYLTAELKGKKAVLDIAFRIRDVYKNRSGQPGQPLQPAPPPPPAPAPAPEKKK
ncbi:MAG TPA: hypothetical protein VMV03_09835 [Spirochaetia bacterium]|nr:hypothetical protein [Spirochaetia bacterium]